MSLLGAYQDSAAATLATKPADLSVTDGHTQITHDGIVQIHIETSNITSLAAIRDWLISIL